MVSCPNCQTRHLNCCFSNLLPFLLFHLAPKLFFSHMNIQHYANLECISQQTLLSPFPSSHQNSTILNPSQLFLLLSHWTTFTLSIKKVFLLKNETIMNCGIDITMPKILIYFQLLLLCLFWFWFFSLLWPHRYPHI